MKMKAFISIILFVSQLTAIGQTVNLNQHNQKGEKHGKWTNLLDEEWKHTEDSAEAVYFRYTYYSNGTNLYPMGPLGGRNYTLESPEDTIRENGLIFLDGEYKWYDGKGRLKYYHILDDGEYVTVKEYFKDGQVQQHFDYTYDCEGHEHGYLIHIYKRNGKKKGAFPYCPVNGKWPPTRQ